jgi:hypothetical protein
MIDFSAPLKKQRGRPKKENLPVVEISTPFPTVADPLDVEAVKKGLIKYDLAIDEMVDQSQGIAVIDEASNVMAIELAGGAKKLNKTIEDYRKELVQPALDYQRSVNNLCKHYQDRLTTIEREVKAKCGQYQQRVELERRKAQEIIRKAQEEAQRQIAAEAKAANVEPPPIVAPVVPEAPKTVRTEQGSMTFKEVWKFEVTGTLEVPREYLIVDERLIRQAVASGVRNIPGVRIYSEKEASIRT